MSTHAAVVPDVASLDAALNRDLLGGNVMDAFEKYYAGDVVMQENLAPPTNGKSANREREVAFFSTVAEVHSVSLLGAAISGNQAFSEWEYHLTFKGGPRTKWAQVSVRQWKDGKVAHERFYYQKN